MPGLVAATAVGTPPAVRNSALRYWPLASGFCGSITENVEPRMPEPITLSTTSGFDGEAEQAADLGEQRGRDRS